MQSAFEVVDFSRNRGEDPGTGYAISFIAVGLSKEYHKTYHREETVVALLVTWWPTNLERLLRK
jgi:hypothetical protein